MRVNKDKDCFDRQSKKDFQRNQQSNVVKPLFTNLKSKLVSSSSIDMHSNRMRGVSDPRTDVDPINFRYLNENYVSKTSLSSRKSSTRFLPISGGAMKGNINMGGNKVVDLPTPTISSSSDTAATVGYVKNRADKVAIDPNLVEKIKKLNDLLKQLEVIEEALGVKPISPDTPPQRRKRETRSKVQSLCSIKAAA